KSPLEPRQEALLEALHITGRAITGHNDLLSALMQLVEDMEEHLLSLLPARKELHVVEYEKIDLQVEVLEVLQLIILQSIQELVGEVVLVDVKDYLIGKVVLNVVADGLNEVCFAHAHSAIQHERIERRHSGFLGHRNARRTCKPITIAFHKIVKCIIRV